MQNKPSEKQSSCEKSSERSAPKAEQKSTKHSHHFSRHGNSKNETSNKNSNVCSPQTYAKELNKYFLCNSQKAVQSCHNLFIFPVEYTETKVVTIDLAI